MSNYKSFACTAKGGSHIKEGKDCQDSSYPSVPSAMTSGFSIAVVADGHGSDNCFRSDKGAKLAVACATNGIQGFIKYIEEKKGNEIESSLRKRLNEIESSLRKRLIEDGIIRAWYKNIADDYEKQPFTKEEIEKISEKYRKRYEKGEDFHHAYGATLIAAAVTNDYWFGFHIGDGRFTALYADGSFNQPVPWDEKCYLNVTTSICDDNAAERTRSYFSFHAENSPPVAIFLCSDGVDDNYPVEGNEKHLFKLYRTIALEYAKEGFENTCEQLKELVKKFANEGKRDDTSIAVIIDMDALKQVAPIWEEQTAKEEKEKNIVAAKEPSIAPASSPENKDELPQTNFDIKQGI